MHLIHVTALGLAAMCTATVAVGDLLELKNGTVIDGRYTGGTIASVRFQAKGETKAYAVKDIMAVTFDAAAITTVDARVAAPTAPPRVATPESTSPKGPSSQVVVPAGTTLTVRMAEDVSTRTHGDGQQFTVVLESDLVAAGSVVAPRGAKAYGILSQVKQSRRLVGQSEMTIMLTKLMSGRRLVPIKTSVTKAVAEKTGRSTMRRAVRGAALGALIDGKGGASTGAKVGLGASILTGGSSVNVPKGTLLDFNLVAPLEVTLEP
jgi:hypothetical protein